MGESDEAVPGRGSVVLPPAGDGAYEIALQRILSGDARVGVIGLGYVGMPLAVALAGAYRTVLGFDIDETAVASVADGRSHIQDVPSEIVAPLVAARRFEATADAARLRECDVITICVPTPLSKTRDPDVSHVVAATESVAQALRPGQLIILESTTYPGTTRELLVPRLERADLRTGREFFVCFSPERVDPGNERWGIHNTPKVIGGITERCVALGAAFYRRAVEHVVPVSSTEAAELTKLLENTFRAVNIALVNEMAQVADRLGVNVFEVIDAAATKPFGFMKFTPGPGIGGHCVPLDPHYLAWKMKTLNYRTRLIDLASEVNSEMPHFVVAKLADLLNERGLALRGSRVLILGVAYKRDVEDVRESPAIDIMRLLAEKGVELLYHDPFVPELDADGVTGRSTAIDAAILASIDCALITTDHSTVDYEALADAGVPVLDTRDAMREYAGPNVIGLSGGRGVAAVRIERAEVPSSPEAD
jgi:UDP-N-acetyl-D-glucosamine dehydrogenase